jgi:hypothetical protein
MEECKNLGATFTPFDDRLRIKAPQPLPDELMADLKQAKSEILAELRHGRRKQAECWMLEEWRRISLPEWRRKLKESIESNNASREEYARWMLREVLDDPEYKEKA